MEGLKYTCFKSKALFCLVYLKDWRIRVETLEGERYRGRVMNRRFLAAAEKSWDVPNFGEGAVWLREMVRALVILLRKQFVVLQ